MMDRPPRATDPAAPILLLSGVSKAFPGVRALDSVDFAIYPGKVHAVVGENGAGKSTLMNLIAGVYQPDGGSIALDGSEIEIASPVHARQLGIVTVFQEAELFAPLSVAENLAFWNGLPVDRFGFVRWKWVYQSAESVVQALQLPFDVHLPAEFLSVGQRHMTQVAAAVAQQARIVIFDEPTSALSAQESEWLFEHIRELRQRGVAILYISHRQEEIFQLADFITVLRDGRLVWHGDAAAIDADGLVQAMVGREATNAPRLPSGVAKPADARPHLRVRDLTAADAAFCSIDTDVFAGEVVGWYGLIGAGRSEVAQSLFGLRPLHRGRVEIDGAPLVLGDVSKAIAAGMAYLPEDRLRQGVCRGLSVQANIVLSSLARWSSWGLMKPRVERSAATQMASDLDIRLRSVKQPIGQLSGGNQQKAVLARWMLTEPSVLILDEPTRGVDVAAKQEIHRLIRAAADRGCAVILISSELPEILAHSDRIAVFRNGTVAGNFAIDEATAECIARAALPLESANPESRDRGASAKDPAVVPPSRHVPLGKWGGRTELGLVAAICLLIGALALTSEGELWRMEFLLGVLESSAVRAILALGAAAVIICGGIDISIGSLLALSAASVGLTMKSLAGTGYEVPAGIAVGLAVGSAGGALNAALALLGRIHPIVVTLGTLTIYRGAMITMTGGNVIAGLPDSFRGLTNGQVAGLSSSILLLIAAVVASHLFFERHRMGRQLFAVGSSETAARLCGISRRWAWLLAFGLGGFAAATAGILELGLNGSMQSVLGTGYELRAIAAAVIGGTAITGGRGSAIGVTLGAILLTLVEKSLVLWSVSQYRNDLVIGGLLTAAILIDRLLRRRTP